MQWPLQCIQDVVISHNTGVTGRSNDMSKLMYQYGLGPATCAIATAAIECMQQETAPTKGSPFTPELASVMLVVALRFVCNIRGCVSWLHGAELHGAEWHDAESHGAELHGAELHWC